MLKPLNKEAAFAAIADDLELPLVLLCSPDSRVRLAQVDKIGAALLSTNLTWRDLAERVVSPRPTTGESALVPHPIPPMATAWPTSEIMIGHDTLRSDEELASHGYRSGLEKGHGGSAVETDAAAKLVDPNQMATNDELRSFGYRSHGLGYGNQGTKIPGVEAPHGVADEAHSSTIAIDIQRHPA